MKQEQREKEAYILKIRRTSQAFEEDVVEVEKSYQAQIESQQVLMKELSDNLEEKKLDVMKAELKLMEEKNSHLAEVLLLRNQIEELIDLNNKLDKKLLEKKIIKDNILTNESNKDINSCIKGTDQSPKKVKKMKKSEKNAAKEKKKRSTRNKNKKGNKVKTVRDNLKKNQNSDFTVEIIECESDSSNRIMNGSHDATEEYTTLERELMETHVTPEEIETHVDDASPPQHRIMIVGDQSQLDSKTSVLNHK
ncbi:hypothetical protein JTB14_031155 [Gonioctena quinquepunctata]|nr:hypothetical protein JTB14_031155 [Gonioctena quinquepunctata]